MPPEQIEQVRTIIREELSTLIKSDRFTFEKFIQILDGRNFQLGTGTGTKIGTATGQKLGFFNTTPVIQPITDTETSVSSAGSGTTWKLDTQTTGGLGGDAYTIQGAIKRLKQLGILK